MKIIQLSFNNIHNLKGHHVISFDELPLKSAGIFAIIGPTGSGKSTILDVITLALFNRIPRFNTPISKTKMNDLGSVMTHYTTSAEAKIIYEVNGNRFTSTWSISKARTGNLKDYEMSISDASGNYLDLKRSEVPAKNEEIIGLKYEQFVKSIILSQGQFSKFLKAGKHERGELLENITGTGIYRKIGRAAFTKFNLIKNEVSDKEQSVKEIITLSDEERRNVHIELKNIEQDKSILDKTIYSLNMSKRIKQDLIDFENKLTKKLIEQSNLLDEITRFEPKQKQLELYDLLIPLKGDIALYQEAIKKECHLEKNISKSKQSLKNALDGLSNVINKMSTLTNQTIDVGSFKLIMSSFEKEVNDMNKDLGFLKSKGSEIRSRINKKIDLSNLDLNEKIGSKEAIKILDIQLEELSVLLGNAKISKNDSLVEITKRIKELRHNLEYLKSFQILKMQVSKLIDKKQLKKDTLNVALQYIENHQPLEQKSRQLVQALSENKINLHLRKEAALKIANLEQLRMELVEGEYCPLCGSLDHPYTKHLLEKESSEIDQLIIKNELSLNNENDKLKLISINIVRALENKKNTQKLLSELGVELENFNDDLDKIKSQNALFKNFTLEQIRDNLELIGQELINLENGLVALQLLKINEELRNGYLELNKVYNKYSDLLIERNKKFEGDDVSQICNELKDKFTIHELQKTKNVQSIELESKSLEEVKSIVSKKSLLLEKSFLILEVDSIDQMIELSLSNEEYSFLKTTNETLIKNKTSLNAELKTLQQDQRNTLLLDKVPKVLLDNILTDLRNSEVQRDGLNTRIGELVSNIKHDDIKRNTRIDKESEIEKLRIKHKKWSFMNDIIGDAKGNNFANFAQGLTLRNLLVFTNKRLVNLTDRYLLDKPKGDGTLMVVDQYQGNTLRSVSTLSGGETFLISLALALSLSDMSSKNVSLDSLFIDEGFGTLDQETLDVALDALERLQSESQKMVGVISHVEALKERITVQIKLVKNAQGYSQLRVEG